MPALPIDNRWTLYDFPRREQIGVRNVECENVDGRPDCRRHIVENDDIKVLRRICQHRDDRHFRVRNGAHGLFHETIASRDKKYLGGMWNEADDRSAIVCFESIVVLDAKNKHAVAVLWGEKYERLGVGTG